MTETATKIDPTATEVRNFLFKSEGGKMEFIMMIK